MRTYSIQTQVITSQQRAGEGRYENKQLTTMDRIRKKGNEGRKGDDRCEDVGECTCMIKEQGKQVKHDEEEEESMIKIVT